jgi:hypothetical protein
VVEEREDGGPWFCEVARILVKNQVHQLKSLQRRRRRRRRRREREREREEV